VREVLEHVMGAEFGFTEVIRMALEDRRAGLGPARHTREERLARGRPEVPAGGRSSVLAALARSHERVLQALTGITDDEVDTPSFFWEEDPYPVRFRLHRFEAHLRQHAVQVQKVLATILGSPSEAQRLLAGVLAALGECEAAVLGAADIGGGSRSEAAGTIRSLADEVRRAAA
jgi:hypothetical protein